jgi:hypothetical protein
MPIFITELQPCELLTACVDGRWWLEQVIWAGMGLPQRTQIHSQKEVVKPPVVHRLSTVWNRGNTLDLLVTVVLLDPTRQFSDLIID